MTQRFSFWEDLSIEENLDFVARMAVAFGNMLHVSGDDAAALEKAIAPFRQPPHEWQRIRSGLEDAFIHLLEGSQDNFGA